MIPYFKPPSLHLGPLTIEPFGLFAAAGIYLAASLMARRARKMGLDVLPLLDYAPWGVGAGVVGGHLVHLFLYHQEELAEGPLRILKVWDGLSSFGGLLGGVIAAIIFFAVKRIPFRRYADAIALGVAPGWGVARLGCFAVHDHPGVKTDFFLAVNFGQNSWGGIRHDLGLYDALMLFALSALLYLIAHRGLLKGRLLALLAILYGVQRFFTDFLRATDVSYADARYAGLTPGQYGCILIVAYGVYQLIRGPAPEPQKAKPAAALSK